ncbi:MAG: dethiobiotin synthase [Verrucomicrobiales bacterium]|nr:dethiobiotin synthase [Verrucomicrobiales bacterium]
MAKAVFITGTDTDVGKTWVAVRLIELMRRRGIRAVGMKPIECGSDDDSRALHAAAADAGVTLEEVNPVHLDEPVAPAAVSEPVEICFEELKTAFGKLSEKADFVVVEGAGGWLVPIDTEKSVADLAACLGVPVVVVAANRLGCLNHTLLTAQAIHSAGVELRGVFLNLFGAEDLSQQSNADQLRQRLDEVPLIDQDLEALADLCLQ